MKNILLVNNQEAFLDRNKSLLNRAGFRIHTATSAGEALDICRQQKVDLIISQVDQPGSESTQFCSLIRQDRELRNVSIIMVCYESEVELAGNCGANAVLTKPVRPELLLKMVGKFLAIRARRDYRAAFNARVEGTMEYQMFSGMTRNISASGMLCEAAISLKQNDLLRNLLFKVASDPIVADGKIVRSARLADGQYSYGVQFIDLASELRDKIDRFVTASEERWQEPPAIRNEGEGSAQGYW